MIKMSKSKTVLVTGAAGFIAFHLIERMLRDGFHVFGIDNFDPFYDRKMKENNIAELFEIATQCKVRFQLLEIDICDLSEMTFKDEKISAIVHLAAKAGVRPSLDDPEGYLKTNIQGTLRVLEFAKARKIKHVLFGSSSSVYGNDTAVPFKEDASASLPISPYAASKRAAEHFCATYAHLYGISIATLRFFTVYGPKQRPDLAIHKFARLILEGSEITLFGDGSTERDYTFVTDIVSGVMQTLEWIQNQPQGKFEVFNLGGSKTTSLKNLVLFLEKSLSLKAKIKWAPLQPGDVERTFADISKSDQILGYSPQISIEEGIKKFSQWLLKTQTANKKAA